MKNKTCNNSHCQLWALTFKTFSLLVLHIVLMIKMCKLYSRWPAACSHDKIVHQHHFWKVAIENWVYWVNFISFRQKLHNFVAPAFPEFTKILYSFLITRKISRRRCIFVNSVFIFEAIEDSISSWFTGFPSSSGKDWGYSLLLYNNGVKAFWRADTALLSFPHFAT